jgi:hypothetical protein
MMVAVVWQLVWFPEETETDPTPSVIPEQPIEVAPVAEVEDTGIDEPSTPTPPKSQPSIPAGGGGKSTPSTPSPPSTPSGEIRLTLDSDIPFTAVEVLCPSGVRKRGYFSNGSTRIAGIPAEACSLNFKGGAPAKYSPVSGGVSLKCSYTGTTMLCR